MTYHVHITAQAETDLENIYRYIAFALHAPKNAAAQLARLERSIYSLDQMPERFRTYQTEPWHTRGLRIMPVDNFVVFYIPNPSSRTVQIVRVLYGRRDIDAELSSSDSEQ